MKRCSCIQNDCKFGSTFGAPIIVTRFNRNPRFISSILLHVVFQSLALVLILNYLQGASGFPFNEWRSSRFGRQAPSYLVVSATTEQKDNDKQRIRNAKFVSPLFDEGYPRVVQEFQNGTITNKPLLLYLPGFDGTWISPFLQFPELSTIFDVRCLTVGMNDRSTFQELKQDVVDYIYTELQIVKKIETDASARQNATTSKNVHTTTSEKSNKGNFFSNLFGGKQTTDGSRGVYLMGESFGGILASEVAVTLLKEHNLEDRVKGLAVINAATCYDRSRFASEAMKITHLPPLLYPFGLMKILPLFMDEHAWPQLLLMLQSKALPSVIDSEEREAFMGRVAFSLPAKLKFMPQETLEWRLTQWLEVGCALVACRLDELSRLKNFRTLIVAGEKDMTLPSIAEAERLSSILPNCHVHVVEGAGHANTCGSRVDLAALCRKRFDELKMRGKRGRKVGRTSMKPQAAKNTGDYFGMEPRYNGKEEGLSPMLYWSKRLWTKPPKEIASK